MIQFACGCGKKFSVPDEFAGKTARCKACSASVTVPSKQEKLPVRTRRLMADAERIHDCFAGSPWVSIGSMIGQPPEIYHVQFKVKSIEKIVKDKPMYRDEHMAEIQLTSEYPRLAPKCRLLTPIFHPNFDATTICVGDHWAAGEHLSDLIVRIAEMLAFQAYNIRSPLNGEAAMWADLNPDQFPTDKRNFHVNGND